VIAEATTFSTIGTGWPVDGHVHLHDISLAERVLDAAAENFRAVGKRTDGFLGALLLAQSASERVYEELVDQKCAGGWTVTPAAGESVTLLAQRDRVVIAVICGRQVRADDGLEILALGTCDIFSDGLPLGLSLAEVIRSEALPVIPWGFGKQIGARGRRVASLMAGCRPRTVYVGDNGSRLEMLGIPAWVRSSERVGFRILPGSDPFPISSDYRRVGSFGFLADQQPDQDAPWAYLRERLGDQPASPQRYGRACGLGHFLRIQIGIQLHKRGRSLSLP